MLEQVKKLMPDQPCIAFQMLSKWYKKKEHLNLPLCSQDLRQLETDYTTLYKKEDLPGESIYPHLFSYEIDDLIPTIA
jgi:hypothetical protein